MGAPPKSNAKLFTSSAQNRVSGSVRTGGACADSSPGALAPSLSGGVVVDMALTCGTQRTSKAIAKHLLRWERLFVDLIAKPTDILRPLGGSLQTTSWAITMSRGGAPPRASSTADETSISSWVITMSRVSESHFAGGFQRLARLALYDHRAT